MRQSDESIKKAEERRGDSHGKLPGEVLMGKIRHHRKTRRHHGEVVVLNDDVDAMSMMLKKEGRKGRKGIYGLSSALVHEQCQDP